MLKPLRIDQLARPPRRRHGTVALGLVLIGLSVFRVVGASTPRFFPDDPLWQYPETQDAESVRSYAVSQGYDFVENVFWRPGENRPVGALNVNTVDEVPDSGWFTNRIGARPMSLEELQAGPDQSSGPAEGVLRVARGKAAGISPGFQMRDSRGDLYFVKFDPPRFPELASAAEVISTKILHAAGYHVPENYVLSVTRARLNIEGATVTGRNQRRRSMTPADLEFILSRAAVHPDGSFRVLASKALPGRPLGPFRYHGTRPDDPNDTIPHEHRRELRGFRVFAAWLNHADSRGINSLDTVVERDGRSIVRHHLLDFGSTLGSAAVDQKSRRSGNENMFDPIRSLLRAVTFGVVVPNWTRVEYPSYPGVGRFEAARFEPSRWVPHYPNPAFDNARADDLFWAARRVMAFSDEAIRAIVQTGQLTDQDSERYLGDTLMARRDAIGRQWLTHINPLVDFSLDEAGSLTFTNAAVAHGVASPPREYRARWGVYDNATDEAAFEGDVQTSAEPRLQAPTELLDRAPAFVKVELSSVHPDYEEWARPMEIYFRRASSEWQTVGVWRLPDR